MKKIDTRLYNFLIKRGISNADMQDFLFPKLSNMLNPFDLDGMREATTKIKDAIANNKNILIFGDYDCDGISASAILVLYLREKGANVSAFIPSRFDDGYGLSTDTIEELCASGNKPDLVITVDLGITAMKEVELLKSRGIDVIVTDHHEPGEILPDCVIIDAKVAGQKYQFSGLCGAGVALKVVEALENREYIKKFLDICAIATIGDIVPLASENRIIAKLGLEKINNGDCHESIKFLLAKLNLGKISSEDISFRIVPRLNSSGRMDNGKKVLDFLVESDKDKLQTLYDAIDADNELRLREIADGNEKITAELKSVDLHTDYAILPVGEFHQGVLGILASRVCHDYNRPAIVFTKTPEGTLKGSGRSVGSIDIHSVLASMSDLFVRFGGHKMAIGMEIVPENFEQFKTLFNQRIKNSVLEYEVQEEKSQDYDIEVTEDDINMHFASDLALLEPFGCENEKPVLMMKANAIVTEQMKGKNYKHYKLHLKNQKQIIAFSCYRHIELLKNKCNKKLYIDIDINEYNGKRNANAKLVKVEYDDNTYEFDNNIAIASGILDRYISYKNTNGNLNCMHLNEQKLVEKVASLRKNKYGTVVVCQNKKTLTKLMGNKEIKNNYIFSNVLPSTKQNCVLIKSSGLQSAENGYTNYVYFSSYVRNEHYLFDKTKNVFDLNLFNSNEFVSCDRNLMANCYKTIKKNHNNIFANDIIEYASKMSYFVRGISPQQMLFAILVFSDLNIINISDYENPVLEINDNIKNELTNSKFYNEFVRIPR